MSLAMIGTDAPLDPISSPAANESRLSGRRFSPHQANQSIEMFFRDGCVFGRQFTLAKIRHIYPRVNQDRKQTKQKVQDSSDAFLNKPRTLLGGDEFIAVSATRSVCAWSIAEGTMRRALRLHCSATRPTAASIDAPGDPPLRGVATADAQCCIPIGAEHLADHQVIGLALA